ncbi:DNA-processing protein DprA [Marinobacter xestospongiae]|uniref:DNA-processing protein DprA n=1 Tax=Marinobacter xestospongiae TaxID=994319 RepID=A0ABU3W1G4_9GAMM|nr:DNA-processing protein DprA [Marinobacter xestospongiae]MDV2080373.1 DNA-processing protein DprA [Marinobacter xestospongiae]
MDHKADYWRNEVVAFLALSSIKGVGYWTLYRLKLPGEGFKDFLKSSSIPVLEEKLKVSLLLDGESPEDWQRRIWETGLKIARELGQIGVRLYFRGQKEFPVQLRAINDGPKWLFVQGEVRNLHNRSIAVVGTRKPSADGEFLTRYVIALLANSGRTVVSGLALGIDQVAHQQSLRFGLSTVAILGNGILLDFPRGSKKLRAEILLNGGTIVTEYLPSQTYSGENFVRRNRIQAALSEFVVPVEWNIKSGTAHTVEYAHKYSRQVVNIYLPGTEVNRPELKFSENYRGAKSFEVPKQTNALTELFEQPLSESSENSAPPEQQSFEI